jgi:hypothetical protein
MTTVSVPQQDGEIRRTLPGEAARVYSVKAGKVTVPDLEVTDFLTDVPGSARVTDKPADDKP